MHGGIHHVHGRGGVCRLRRRGPGLRGLHLRGGVLDHRRGALPGPRAVAARVDGRPDHRRRDVDHDRVRDGDLQHQRWQHLGCPHARAQRARGAEPGDRRNRVSPERRRGHLDIRGPLRGEGRDRHAARRRPGRPGCGEQPVGAGRHRRATDRQRRQPLPQCSVSRSGRERRRDGLRELRPGGRLWRGRTGHRRGRGRDDRPQFDGPAHERWRRGTRRGRRCGRDELGGHDLRDRRRRPLRGRRRSGGVRGWRWPLRRSGWRGRWRGDAGRRLRHQHRERPGHRRRERRRVRRLEWRRGRNAGGRSRSRRPSFSFRRKACSPPTAGAEGPTESRRVSRAAREVSARRPRSATGGCPSSRAPLLDALESAPEGRATRRQEATRVACAGATGGGGGAAGYVFVRTMSGTPAVFASQAVISPSLDAGSAFGSIGVR